MEISLCMIVKDEEAILNRCLLSVQNLVDEIVIVDTGSTDTTKMIAQQYGAKIFDFTWCNDFSRARNYAFGHASKEYILWLDADDYISPENQSKLLALKNDGAVAADSISMIYSLVRDKNGVTTCSLRRNRIVKRANHFQWIGSIHEYLDVKGAVFHSDIEIWHDKHRTHSDRNLKIYQKMVEKGVALLPRDQYYYANELYDNLLYEQAIQVYEAFLAQGLGWVEDNKQATVRLVACLEKTNQFDRIMPFILNSFQWGIPHAELCCRLAECFLRQDRLEETVFWYQAAFKCVPAKDAMALHSTIYYTFIPAIQLCVCYCKLGDYQTAQAYNELAGLHQPDSPLVEHNRQYLSEQLNKTSS